MRHTAGATMLRDAFVAGFSLKLSKIAGDIAEDDGDEVIEKRHILLAIDVAMESSHEDILSQCAE